MGNRSAVAGGLSLRRLQIEWGRRTYVMAIINATPDSFSGDGVANSVPAAIDLAREALEAGADLVDVGGESTRPGSTVVTASEELERVVPVIDALRCRFDIPISIDTYKAAVAEAALDAGADLVNDVWGLRADPQLVQVVARRGVPIVIMHNRSNPDDAKLSERLGGHYVGVEYGDLVADVCTELGASVDLAREAGVRPEHIIVDPGIGFGKTTSQNLELLDRLAAIRGMGYPVLIGPSRKSFIGLTMNLPPGERIEGTAAAVAVAVTRGADIVRVHDVRAMARVARMSDAIVRPRRPGNLQA
jgi:dihydropteroate synthase